MFNLHLWKKKEEKSFGDKLFEAKDKMEKEQPAPKPEMEYYSIGPSSEGRVILRVPYGNVSLNVGGIDNLIAVLESAKRWVDESGKQPEDGCQEEETPV